MLKRKTAWRDGTTHLAIAQLDFMQWLAALVARPHLDLIRLRRACAQRRLRVMVVSQWPVEGVDAAKPVECGAKQRLLWGCALIIFAKGKGLTAKESVHAPVQAGGPQA